MLLVSCYGARTSGGGTARQAPPPGQDGYFRVNVRPDVALGVSGDFGPVSRLGGGAAASTGFWWRPSGLGVSRENA